ncbi:hypothetical protein B0H13DRAFT_1928310 [Mycena leptocephala]|nr:hypothetical protein B0H13DRAFT_1928310 [Mycena leptocephala]
MLPLHRYPTPSLLLGHTLATLVLEDPEAVRASELGKPWEFRSVSIGLTDAPPRDYSASSKGVTQDEHLKFLQLAASKQAPTTYRENTLDAFALDLRKIRVQLVPEDLGGCAQLSCSSVFGAW